MGVCEWVKYRFAMVICNNGNNGRRDRVFEERRGMDPASLLSKDELAALLEE
jgi:hypothetical protein